MQWDPPGRQSGVVLLSIVDHVKTTPTKGDERSSNTNQGDGKCGAELKRQWRLDGMHNAVRVHSLRGWHKGETIGASSSPSTDQVIAVGEEPLAAFPHGDPTTSACCIINKQPPAASTSARLHDHLAHCANRRGVFTPLSSCVVPSGQAPKETQSVGSRSIYQHARSSQRNQRRRPRRTTIVNEEPSRNKLVLVRHVRGRQRYRFFVYRHHKYVEKAGAGSRCGDERRYARPCNALVCAGDTWNNKKKKTPTARCFRLGARELKGDQAKSYSTGRPRRSRAHEAAKADSTSAAGRDTNVRVALTTPVDACAGTNRAGQRVERRLCRNEFPSRSWTPNVMTKHSVALCYVDEASRNLVTGSIWLCSSREPISLFVTSACASEISAS